MRRKYCLVKSEKQNSAHQILLLGSQFVLEFYASSNLFPLLLRRGKVLSMEKQLISNPIPSDHLNFVSMRQWLSYQCKINKG